MFNSKSRSNNIVESTSFVVLKQRYSDLKHDTPRDNANDLCFFLFSTSNTKIITITSGSSCTENFSNFNSFEYFWKSILNIIR